jgi:hypothetical protein
MLMLRSVLGRKDAARTQRRPSRECPSEEGPKKASGDIAGWLGSVQNG